MIDYLPFALLALAIGVTLGGFVCMMSGTLMSHWQAVGVVGTLTIASAFLLMMPLSLINEFFTGMPAYVLSAIVCTAYLGWVCAVLWTADSRSALLTTVEALCVAGGVTILMCIIVGILILWFDPQDLLQPVFELRLYYPHDEM